MWSCPLELPAAQGSSTFTLAEIGRLAKSMKTVPEFNERFLKSDQMAEVLNINCPWRAALSVQVSFVACKWT